jgi:galactokinase
VPIGAEPSSSAALTVAAARALGLLAGRSLPPADLVEVAFHAERGTALLLEAGIGTFRPHGARLTGAAWGGAVVVLAPGDRETRIVAEARRDFGDRFGRVPEAWSTRASAGARREALLTLAG